MVRIDLSLGGAAPFAGNRDLRGSRELSKIDWCCFLKSYRPADIPIKQSGCGLLHGMSPVLMLWHIASFAALQHHVGDQGHSRHGTDIAELRSRF